MKEVEGRLVKDEEAVEKKLKDAVVEKIPEFVG